MLKAYKASTSCLAEHVQAFGNEHRTTANIKKSELLHLTALFGSEELPAGTAGRSSMTELIQHIRSDNSGLFSNDDRNCLMEAAVARLSGATSEDFTQAMHGSQKSQTHLASHNYLDDQQWDYVLDTTKTLKNKMTFISKIWLQQWGLRYPSAPTFRSGLALLLVCSKLDCDPTAAYQHLQAFMAEFRKLRSLYSGEASVKVFPEDPSDFKTSHPACLGDYVECRIEVAAIIELARPRAIPCKLSNSSLAASSSRRPSALTSSSSTGPLHANDMLRGLLQFALAGGSDLQLSPPSAGGTRSKKPAALTMSPATAPSGDLPAITDVSSHREHRLSKEAASLLMPTAAEDEEDEDEEDEPAAAASVDKIAEQTAAFIEARKEENKKKKQKELDKKMKEAQKAAAATTQPKRRRIVGKSPATLLAEPMGTSQKVLKRPGARKQPMTLAETFKKMIADRLQLSRNAFCSRAYTAGKAEAKRSGKAMPGQNAFARAQHKKAGELWKRLSEGGEAGTDVD